MSLYMNKRLYLKKKNTKLSIFENISVFVHINLSSTSNTNPYYIQVFKIVTDVHKVLLFI